MDELRREFHNPAVAPIARVAARIGALMSARQGIIDPELLARAQRGELTTSNTAKGTPERQAVDRMKYLRRRSAHPELTARQALGHPKPDDVLPRISLMVDEPPRYLIIEALSRRDLSRAGTYGDLVNRLEMGRIDPTAFRLRVRTWRPIAGFQFLPKGTDLSSHSAKDLARIAALLDGHPARPSDI